MTYYLHEYNCGLGPAVEGCRQNITRQLADDKKNFTRK